MADWQQVNILFFVFWIIVAIVVAKLVELIAGLFGLTIRAADLWGGIFLNCFVSALLSWVYFPLFVLLPSVIVIKLFDISPHSILSLGGWLPDPLSTNLLFWWLMSVILVAFWLIWRFLRSEIQEAKKKRGEEGFRRPE